MCTAMADDNGASIPPRPQYIPNKIDDPNYVRIFDTTLRDGEQSPGATLTRCELHPHPRGISRSVVWALPGRREALSGDGGVGQRRRRPCRASNEPFV